MSIVEEEPSHEIYASLIGKDPAETISDASSSSSSSISTTTRTMHPYPQHSAIFARHGPTIVPLDPHAGEEIDVKRDTTSTGSGQSSSTANVSTITVAKTNNKDSKSTFANFYRRALSSSTSTPLSMLSLDKTNKG